MAKGTLAFKHFAKLVAVRLLGSVNNNVHTSVFFMHGRSIAKRAFLTSRFWVIMVVLKNQRAHLLHYNCRKIELHLIYIITELLLFVQLTG